RALPPPALPSFPTRRSSDLRFRRLQRLHRSGPVRRVPQELAARRPPNRWRRFQANLGRRHGADEVGGGGSVPGGLRRATRGSRLDRKSTRLNSSHVKISYAV